MGKNNRCVVPVMGDGSGSGGGLGSLTKKTPELRSWILMDASGQEMYLKEDKYAIMGRVQIHARDFRILDPLFSCPSKILCREKAIVLNLEHIKAIVTAEEVLVLNPLDDNVIPFVEQLRRRLLLDNDRGNNPFEFKALEIALEAICGYLDAHSTEVENAAYPALDMLTSKISNRKLDLLRSLKSQMTRVTARVQKVKDELHQLLNDDQDMADLCLSRKLVRRSSTVSDLGAGNWSVQPFRTASKMPRTSNASLSSVLGGENDVGRLEMLIEAFFIQIDGTLSRITTLREYIDSTEDFIKIKLLNRRNRLFQLDLALNFGILSLGINSLITGFFGMNFPYTWSNDGYGYTFKWVVILSCIITALLFIMLIAYARHKGLVGS